MTMTLALLYAGSFLLGSIPTAYLVAKTTKGIDIRQHGSGNVGATNALRVLGKKWALAVFAVDFLKGVVPVCVAFAVLGGRDTGVDLLALGAGIAAVVGHIYTPFLGFKGGKGIATGAGALCAAYPPLFGVSLVLFGVVFYFSRIVSLSALVAVGVVVPASWARFRDGRLTLLFLLIFLFLCWTHRQNIGRLLRGEEKPIA